MSAFTKIPIVKEVAPTHWRFHHYLIWSTLTGLLLLESESWWSQSVSVVQETSRSRNLVVMFTVITEADVLRVAGVSGMLLSIFHNEI